MFLRFRNTYKTKKIMLLYCFVCIISITLFALGILLLFMFNKWWMYLLLMFIFAVFVSSFFLLVLENNGYNVKYYFNKKKYKELYTSMILKYEIKNIKEIKRETKDYFYQYGNLDEKNMEIRTLIITDWVDKQKNKQDKEDINVFLCDLLQVVCSYEEYRYYLNYFIKKYSENQIINFMNDCKVIKKEFKEKCVFIYNNPMLVTFNFLDNIFIELMSIIEYKIGIIAEEGFNYKMYNDKYYYSKDKRIAYYIEKKEDLFVIFEKNFDVGYTQELLLSANDYESAEGIIKELIQKYNNEKEQKIWSI